MNELILPEDKIAEMKTALNAVRAEYKDNKYIVEARKVFAAGGIRSTIGSYWNATVDDLRKKVFHRGIDLFNKEMKAQLPREIKDYEGMQDHVTDYVLIDGAYKIGVLSREAMRVLHQARETRNIFDGHPDSDDPTILKALNLIADCNKYVLSVDNPEPIVNINGYLDNMDSGDFHRNEVSVLQVVTSLPVIYKSELAHKLVTGYIKDTATTHFRSNAEFVLPILWTKLNRDLKQDVGKHLERLIVQGKQTEINQCIKLFTYFDGLQYTTEFARISVFTPAIKFMEDHQDDWSAEASGVRRLLAYGFVIPEELRERYVACLLKTYLGYGGYYSWNASPIIDEIFSNLDESFVILLLDLVEKDEVISTKLTSQKQLFRLKRLLEIIAGEVQLGEATLGLLKRLLSLDSFQPRKK